MTDILTLKARRNIYNIVKKNPGLHLSKIADLLNMRISHVEYHLFYLEKYDLVFSIMEEKYKRYYPKSINLGLQDRNTLSIIRREIPLTIILFLLKNPRSTHKKILEQVSISKSTLSYHLKTLVERQILEIVIAEHEKTYRVKDKEYIEKLLHRFKPYSAIESFEDIFLDFSVK